jgi:PAS domain S-box-containing protein
MDFDATILDLNQQAVELLGQSVTELIGSPWATLLDDHSTAYEEAIRSLRESRQAHLEMSVPSDGGLRTLEAHMTVIDYEEGEAIQWIGHDITEQTELARMRDDLMHMIVHDLRNPLSNIVSSLQMMYTAFVEKDETLPMIEVLQVAMRSSKRLRRLIDSLLDIRQLEEGKADLDRIAVPPKTLASEAIELVRPIVEKKRQQLNVEIPTGLPLVWVDRDMIIRVLTNLLDNAAKFTRTRGALGLKIEETEEELLFAVSDTGPGISPESQEHIFRRFQRLESAKGTKGTGLGLSFCKLAVEAHGGRIWVDSKPDEGSRFTFSLPLEAR